MLIKSRFHANNSLVRDVVGRVVFREWMTDTTLKTAIDSTTARTPRATA